MNGSSERSADLRYVTALLGGGKTAVPNASVSMITVSWPWLTDGRFERTSTADTKQHLTLNTMISGIMAWNQNTALARAPNHHTAEHLKRLRTGRYLPANALGISTASP